MLPFQLPQTTMQTAWGNTVPFVLASPVLPPLHPSCLGHPRDSAGVQSIPIPDMVSCFDNTVGMRMEPHLPESQAHRLESSFPPSACPRRRPGRTGRTCCIRVAGLLFLLVRSPRFYTASGWVPLSQPGILHIVRGWGHQGDQAMASDPDQRGDQAFEYLCPQHDVSCELSARDPTKRQARAPRCPAPSSPTSRALRTWAPGSTGSGPRLCFGAGMVPHLRAYQPCAGRKACLPAASTGRRR